MKKCLMLALVAAAAAFSFNTPAVEANGCPQGPKYTYVANSPEECAVIRFTCPEGSAPFFNDCGCGCVEQ